jgi:hypothetical protein
VVAEAVNEIKLKHLSSDKQTSPFFFYSLIHFDFMFHWDVASAKIFYILRSSQIVTSVWRKSWGLSAVTSSILNTNKQLAYTNPIIDFKRTFT